MTPHKTISPIECVMDAKSALQWVRENAVEGWCNRLLPDRREKIWSTSPAHNMKKGLPPMIKFYGLDDEILKTTDDFLREFRLLD